MTTTPLSERILEDAQKAAKDLNYEAAYHLLMAALHIADKSGDMDLVFRVDDLAKHYGNAVDSVLPPHPLSRTAAKNRGQTPLYVSIQIHAHTVALRHSTDRFSAR